jgi:hypothetical protein
MPAVPVLRDRVTPGKYALVRTALSASAADYAGRAQACGLTGLVFKLNDKDRPMSEWLPDPAGEDWQRLQYMLGPAGGLDDLIGYGLKVGVVFDAGRGAYEVPTAEGSSWAGIMRLLDPLGTKIDFYMADITIEPRWAVASNVQAYFSPWVGTHATPARALSALITSSRVAQAGRLRPIYLITPAEPLADWLGLYNNLTSGHDGFGVLASTDNVFCNAVLNLAHRVDPANGTSDISTAWLWHQTVYGTQTMVRGEFVFDLRTTSADAETLKGMVQYVVDGFDVTTSDLGAGCDCTWHPTAGLVMFDDLDAIESKGLYTAVGEAITPTDFWDLDIYEGGPCLLGPVGELVWWSLGQVPALVAGQPWEMRLAVESWRLGRLPNWIFLYGLRPCASYEDPSFPWFYPGWISVGSSLILLNAGAGFSTRVEDELEDYVDPATGLSHKVFRLSGTPSAADADAYTLQLTFYGGFLAMNECGRFLLVVTPASTILPSIGSGGAASDMLHPILPSMGALVSPCMPIPTGPGPGPVTPPGPGGVGDCGQTTTLSCPDGTYEVCNAILNLVWVVAGQTSDWEEMAFYIAVMVRESAGYADAAGDCCPNPALNCALCATCTQSDHPTTCCCSFGLFMLNRCGGQGAGMTCAQLLDPATNASVAMASMKPAWDANKAAGLTGIALYKAVAADSGHPGSSASGELSRQWIARFTQCLVAMGSLSFPLPSFWLSWPMRAPLTADCAWHMASPEALSAIDIGCTPGVGGETIKAAHDGYVTFAGLDPTTVDNPATGYGYMVEIRDKAFGEYVTRYGHMKAGSLMVSTGDEVARGDGIGLCGNTGHSTGYHLHFELRHSGVTVCPCTYLEGGC